MEEAILQGFFELAERDSVALWWYNRVRRPAVDLRSLDDPYFENLTAYYRTLGRSLHVLDITTDLAIPSFAAVTYRTDGDEADITLGFGAHFDPRLGVLRALTEANQFLPAVMQRHGRRGAAFQTNDEEVLDWLRTSTLATRPYLVPDGERSATQLVNHQRADIRDEVESCVEIAAARGIEVLVLDQTRPDIGLPVVRVVAPGLRHFWARFAAGRLYDVPVQLGWLPHARSEDELNPTPVFF